MANKFTPGPWGATPVALFEDDRITLSVLRVYIALSSFQGMKDDCSPGMADIAERALLSERQVIRAIHVLKKLDWVEVARRGLGKTNIYRVRMDARSDKNDNIRSDTAMSPTEVTPSVTSLSSLNPSYPDDNNTKKTIPAIAGSGHHEVMQGLEKIHGQQYANYKREGKALKMLLERVEKMYPGKVAGDLVLWMGRFLSSLSDDKFWKTVPVSPSSLLSHWDRLYTMARAKAGEQDWEHMSSPMTKKEEA